MTQPLHQESGQPAIGRWTAPGSNAVFTMDSALLQKVRGYVLEGFNILPRRGAEMGGLLLGRILSDLPLQIEITGFEPVPCEYRYGPSYILSDNDRARLQVALSQFSAPGQGNPSAPVVVGCFRSCTGRELALDAADQQMMRNYFPDPRQILLSIHPLSIFECEAWFFHRQDGVLPRLPSHPPEPFGRYEPPSMAPPRKRDEPPAPAAGDSLASLHQAVAPQQKPPQPAAGAPAETSTEPPEAWHMVERRRRARGRRFDDQPAEEREPAQEAPPPQPPQFILQEASPRPGPHYPLWQLALVLLLLLATAGYGYQWWDAQQRARWAHLGLDAQPGPAGMEVTWDKTAPALQEASRAVLEVEEAGAAPAGDNAAPPVTTKRMELDGRALSQGRLNYPTASSDVLFRLNLYGAGLAAATESIRVVGRTRERGALPAALTSTLPPAPEPVKAPAAVPPPERPVERAEAGQAEIVHQEQPEVPEGVRARIREPITVPVQVEIDDRGHVTHAAAQGDGDGVYRYLAAKAALAAQAWVFRPAKTADGRATASRQTLHFTFRN